jgi:CheY-like chemotaxis protein
MGLAIVHGIMKDHRGEVSAYSEVGKGTVFNLYFPVVEEVAEPRLMPQPEPRGSGQRIIYVDDEEPLVLLISRTLKRLDYEVYGFTDPVEALKAFQRDPHGFDALVTDLSMPMMSGTELAREFLEIRKDLPVVLTSGYLRPQDREIAKSAGVLELILKPDTAEELGSTLNRLLGKNAKASRAAGQGQ